MKVLFLAHRIPYPPNKGDKIRAFHILKHLANSHEVFLGTLVDDPNDMAHRDSLRPYCRDMFCAPTHRLGRVGRQLSAALSRTPLSVASFRHGDLRRWVADMLQSVKPDVVYVSSSAMFEHVRTENLSNARLIVDFVDVDSEKWKQYATLRPPPASWLFAEEARRLLHYDRALARTASACLFVSKNERDLFAQLAPDVRDKLYAVPNGVDAEYFSAPARTATQGALRSSTIVFTGMMDYWPNVDAVEWFARSIFPSIRERLPHAEFVIVGARPTSAVMALREIAGVQVTGAVPDVRPYLTNAGVVVAPLRVARGIQNKVLEGMSMARPVIATPRALEGIGARHGKEVMVAQGEEDFITWSSAALLTDEMRLMGGLARDYVLGHHDWTANLAILDEIVAGAAVHGHISPEVPADQR